MTINQIVNLPPILEKALESFKNQSIDFQIEFHPFELNGDLPKQGADKLTLYRKKFGNERVEKMVPFMKAAGLEYGVHFTYSGLMANTFDSHRLIALAKTKGLQYQLNERLLQAYHEESQNIGDHHVLAENYGKVGGDVQEALNFLASDELLFSE
ncbi:hypothetical protein BC833DRAFT_626708 [Globomyces pollinis-pini]|nr:hypothetical protein BC833DRAFT_626708 [Globomyces pollinis-pini]